MTDAGRRDLRGELEDFDGYPESWRPDVGEIIVGEVLRYDSGHTEYGEYPIAVLRDKSTGEERGVWLMHTVLRDEFEEKRPKPGERVGIKRLPDADKGYKRYAVRVDRDEPEMPEFDDYAEPGDVPPQDREALREEERSFQEKPASAEDPGDEFSEEALTGGEDDLPF